MVSASAEAALTQGKKTSQKHGGGKERRTGNNNAVQGWIMTDQVVGLISRPPRGQERPHERFERSVSGWHFVCD